MLPGVQHGLYCGPGNPHSRASTPCGFPHSASPIASTGRARLRCHGRRPRTGNSHSRGILPLLAILDAPPACFAHWAWQASVLAKYNAARRVQNGRTISPFIDAGGVAAAILTKQGNIYVGVCIDTASTLGMCAERNAIANMITNGESRIDKVVAVMPAGRVGSPCGACREYMMQLDKNSGEIEILLDLEKRRTVKLKELIPDWWGTERFMTE